MAFADYTTSANHTIRPIQELARGGEGIVYALADGDDTVAKIYHPSLRVSERERKLRAMIKSPPHDDTRDLSPPHVSIAWPIDVLYEQGRFAGFVMPRISDSPTIFQFYNPQLREQNPLSFDWRHLHHIGKNLATALNALHARGYVMGDVNQKNILVTSNALVTLVDTDSFQVHDETYGQTYRCPVGVPEYTPPELQRVRLGSVDRKPLHDCFGLSVLLFQLLMEGFHPFTGAPKNPTYSLPGELYLHCITKGIFPYQTNGEFSPPPNAPGFSVLHPELQDMFLRAFVQGHRQPSARPTAREWISALDRAESELVQCEKNPGHRYSGHTHKCHWCERESMKPLPMQQPLAAPPPKSSAAGSGSAPTAVSTSATTLGASLLAKSESNVPWLAALIAGIVGLALVRLLSEYVGYIPYSPASHLGMNDGPVTSGCVLGLFMGLLLGIGGPIYGAKQSAESVLGIVVLSLCIIPFTIVIGPLLGSLIGMLVAWIITLLLPVVLGLVFGAVGGVLVAMAVQQYSSHDEIPAGFLLGAIVGGIVAIIAWGTGKTFLANCLFVPLFAWAGYTIGREFDMAVTAPSYPQTQAWLRLTVLFVGLFALGLFLNPAIMGAIGCAGLLVGTVLAINKQERAPALIGAAFCAAACLGVVVGNQLPEVEKPVTIPAVAVDKAKPPSAAPTTTTPTSPPSEPFVSTSPSVATPPSAPPQPSGHTEPHVASATFTPAEPSAPSERATSPSPTTPRSNNRERVENAPPSSANAPIASALRRAVHQQPFARTWQRSASSPSRPRLSGKWQANTGEQFQIDDDGTTIAIKLVASRTLRELSGRLTQRDPTSPRVFAGTMDAAFFAASRPYSVHATAMVSGQNFVRLQFTDWPASNKTERQTGKSLSVLLLKRQTPLSN